MNRSVLSISGIVLLGAIVVLLNGVSRSVLTQASVDFTEEGLYTLTEGTNQVLASIDEPITLRFYFSKTDSSKYPAMGLFGNRVRDLLRQYERRAGGKVVLEVYDPRPDSEEEEWAEKYGLEPLPTQSGERLFLGLAAVNSLGDEEAIPLFNFNRQEFIEYDVTKILHSLVNTERPTIGVLSSRNVRGSSAKPPNPLAGSSPQGWFFINQLEKFGEVRHVGMKETTLDDSIDLLVLIHPKRLVREMLYAIDQFVMKGGKLVVMMDPYSQADEPEPDPKNPMAGVMASRASTLNKLLSAWGVEMTPGKVIADRAQSARVNTGRGGAPVQYPVWLVLDAESMDREDVSTSSLETMVFPWAGPLELKEVDGATVTPLLFSSSDSMLLEDSNVKFGGGDPVAMLRSFVPSGKEYVVAARISGKLKSNYPDGDPSAPEVDGGEMSTINQHRKVSDGISHVVVTSDVDFATNRFSVDQQNIFGAVLTTMLNDNLIFMQNVIENLAGSDELISIRSRGRFHRPFTKVAEIERSAQSRWVEEEMVLQAKLNAANQRLKQVQSKAAGDNGGKQVVTKAMFEELKKYRDERREMQHRLREVRRNLRKDKERLGEGLFLLNTFLVPVLLILFSLVFYARKKNKKAKTS